MTIAQRLVAFIAQDLLEGKSPVGEGTRLFSSKLLDSLALVEILTYLEEEFGVKIKASEIKLDHFDTAGLMAALVQSKLDEGAGAQAAHG